MRFSAVKCDICGKFTSPITATRRLLTPDSEFTTETWETICRECKAKEESDE